MRLIPAYAVADIANATESNVSNRYIVGYANVYIYSIDGKLLKVENHAFRYVYFYTYFSDIHNVVAMFIRERVAIYVKPISETSSSYQSQSTGDSTFDKFHSGDVFPPALFQCNRCMWGGFPCTFTTWTNSTWSTIEGRSSRLRFSMTGIDKPAQELISLGVFYDDNYFPLLKFLRRYNITLTRSSSSTSWFSSHSFIYAYSKLHCARGVQECPKFRTEKTNFYRFSFSVQSSSFYFSDVVKNNKYALQGMESSSGWWYSTQSYIYEENPAGMCINGETVWIGPVSQNFGCMGYCYSRSRSTSSPYYVSIGCLTDRVQ